MNFDQNSALLQGVAPMEALSFLSENDKQYQVTVHCGSAEAAERQRRAGNGKVTEDGYQRTFPHEVIKKLAEDDENVSVEVIGE